MTVTTGAGTSATGPATSSPTRRPTRSRAPAPGAAYTQGQALAAYLLRGLDAAAPACAGTPPDGAGARHGASPAARSSRVTATDSNGVSTSATVGLHRRRAAATATIAAPRAPARPTSGPARARELRAAPTHRAGRDHRDLSRARSPRGGAATRHRDARAATPSRSPRPTRTASPTTAASPTRSSRRTRRSSRLRQSARVWRERPGGAARLPVGTTFSLLARPARDGDAALLALGAGRSPGRALRRRRGGAGGARGCTRSLGAGRRLPARAAPTPCSSAAGPPPASSPPAATA